MELNKQIRDVFRDFSVTMLKALHKTDKIEDIAELEGFKKLEKELEELGLMAMRVTTINGECSCTIESKLDKSLYEKANKKLEEQLKEPNEKVAKLNKQISEIESLKKKAEDKSKDESKNNTARSNKVWQLTHDINEYNKQLSELRKQLKEPSKEVNTIKSMQEANEKLIDACDKLLAKVIFKAIKACEKPDAIANFFKCTEVKEDYEKAINEVATVKYARGDLTMSNTKLEELNEVTNYFTNVIDCLQYGLKTIDERVSSIIQKIVSSIRTAKKFSDIYCNEKLSSVKFTLNCCKNHDKFREFISCNKPVRLSFCEFLMLENRNFGSKIVLEYVNKTLKTTYKKIDESNQNLASFFEANPMCLHITNSKKTDSRLTFIELMFNYENVSLWLKRDMTAQKLIDAMPELFFTTDDINGYASDATFSYIKTLFENERYDDIKALVKHFSELVKEDYEIKQQGKTAEFTIKHMNLNLFQRFENVYNFLDNEVYSKCEEFAKKHVKKLDGKKPKKADVYNAELEAKKNEAYADKFLWFDEIKQQVKREPYFYSNEEIEAITKKINFDEPVKVLRANYYPCNQDEKDFIEKAVKQYEAVQKAYELLCSKRDEKKLSERNEFIQKKIEAVYTSSAYKSAKPAAKKLMLAFYARNFMLDFEETRYNSMKSEAVFIGNMINNAIDENKKAEYTRAFFNRIMTFDSFCATKTHEMFSINRALRMVPLYRLDVFNTDINLK